MADRLEGRVGPMVITIQINRIETGLYRAAAAVSGGEVAEAGLYSSIQEAIREEATSIPDGFAYFANVTYGGASSGTISLPELLANANQVADQLVAVVAAIHRVAGLRP